MSQSNPAAIDEYLALLPLGDTDLDGLRIRALQRGDDRRTVFAELHRSIGPAHEVSAEPPSVDSIGNRLQAAFASPPRRGDSHRDKAVTADVRGNTRLTTMPALNRAAMVPTPWENNPLRRLWQYLQRKLLGGHVGLAGRDGRAANAVADADVESAAPKAVWQGAGTRRRLVLLGLMLAQTAIATYYMTAVMPYHGTFWLETITLALYAILFLWVSAGFWTAMMGFFVLLVGHDRFAISRSAAADMPITDSARTAILIPICNEDVARVYAGLRATYDSLARTGHLQHFDFYILSDSGDPDVRQAELEAWLQLCREVDGFGRIYYRRRQHRIKRKSGNIADWCRRWGSNYRYMVILDADSVMSGGCLTRLVQLMEGNPRAGIIQTAPRAAGRETLYSRIQQFATRIYGPLFTAGLHYWQLGESHYWGHNAIIRVAPFIRHCALGRIPGHGSLAGEIMSHDFVEAALMRRAGWSVWIAYDLPGSYEEMPPNLLDELKRDRRWCQGNLQNFQLFLAQGLHPAHRAVFMTGVMAYLSAPLWFLFLVLSTALVTVQTLSPPEYFQHPYQLFPIWPEWHPEWAIALFSATATLLFLPKILSVLVVIVKGSREYGGPLALIGSLFIEMLFSALLAPIRMLFHTQFVTAALLGITIQWKSPPREDTATPWMEAIARHGPGTALGIIWASYIYWLNPHYLWWLLPIVGSLILAVPLSVWSSRVPLGRAFRKPRLFLIPEESNTPRELRWTRLGVKKAAEPSNFRRAVVDPVSNAIACAYANPRARRPAAVVSARLRLVATALNDGPNSLTAIQKNTLIHDPVALSNLHFQVWAAADAHPDWKKG